MMIRGEKRTRKCLIVIQNRDMVKTHTKKISPYLTPFQELLSPDYVINFTSACKAK